MPLPTNLSAYDDIGPILNAAKDSGGAKLSFASAGDAYYWRMRAYTYRTLLRNQASVSLLTADATTPYDAMVIRLSGTDLIIQFEPRIKPVLITGLDGEELNPAALEDADETEDELSNEARELILRGFKDDK